MTPASSLIPPAFKPQRYDLTDHCPLCGALLDALGRCPDSAWHDTDLYGPDDLHD